MARLRSSARGWVISLGLLLAWLGPGCVHHPHRTTVDTTPPQPYLRASHGPDGAHNLEIAARALRPVRGRGPTLWLVGVSHLGTTEYYTELQRFLDAQPLVLFEGVGATNKTFQLQHEGGFSLQSALARALKLRFQLETIDYQRPNFRNSDLSLEELDRILSGPAKTSNTAAAPAPGTAPAGRTEPAPAAGGAAFDQLLDAMRGTGLLGGLARFGVALIEASPRLQAATLVTLVEVLAQLPGDLPNLPGMPAGFQQLFRVLIEERDRKVLDDVKRELHARPAPASIAIFYGAGHMPDLERRLRNELAYRPADERWWTAFGVNARQAGVSEWEINLMRSWARAQMNGLKPEGTKP